MDTTVFLKHLPYSWKAKWNEDIWDVSQTTLKSMWILYFTPVDYIHYSTREKPGKEHRNKKCAALIFRGCRISSVPHILNGPSGYHFSRRKTSQLVWKRGSCIRAFASIISIGKPVLKLGILTGNQPETVPSGHIRLGLTYLKIMVYTAQISL